MGTKTVQLKNNSDNNIEDNKPNQVFKTDDKEQQCRMAFVGFNQSILKDFNAGNEIQLTPVTIEQNTYLDPELKTQLNTTLEDFQSKVPLRNKINDLLQQIETVKEQRKGNNKAITMIIDNLILTLKTITEKLSKEAIQILTDDFKKAVGIATEETKKLQDHYTDNGKPSFFTLQSTATDLMTLSTVFTSETFTKEAAISTEEFSIQ